MDRRKGRRFSSPPPSRRRSRRLSKSKTPAPARSRSRAKVAEAAAAAGGAGAAARKRALLQVLGFLALGLLSALLTRPDSTSNQLADVDVRLRKNANWIQTQVDMIDTKISQEMASLNAEVERMLDTEAFVHIQSDVHKLKTRLESLASSLGQLQLQQEQHQQQDEQGALELQYLVEAVADSRAQNGSGKLLNLEDLRVVTKRIVEDAIEDHSADGIGRVDYALASGGGKVLGHSEAYYPTRPLLGTISSIVRDYGIHPKAHTMLEPSFGEPGQCLPLKGTDVYVDIQLRKPIYPNAVTLQHASKKVAYDIGSAPKDFQVFGWLHLPSIKLPLAVVPAGNNRSLAIPATEARDMVLLGSFTYQLEKKSSVQNFKLSCSRKLIVNRVRLHVVSNHGCPTHTCLYRFRVHGHS